MEVRNIRIDGQPNRDAAVEEATRQAAAQVWSKIGHGTALPALSSAQLQAIASYVDVANEVAQPNFYAGNFNIGIRLAALMRATGQAPANESTAADTGGETRAAAQSSSPASSETSDRAATSTSASGPAWVLVIPGHEQNGTISLWETNSPWVTAWQTVSASGVATAVAAGDPADKTELGAEAVQNFDPQLTSHLRALANKYNAPAVALILLKSSGSEIRVNEEVSLELTYLEREAPEALTAQDTLFVSATTLPTIYPTSVTAARRLLARLSGTEQTANASTAALNAQMANTLGNKAFGTSYSTPAVAPDSTNKLWVRIPLAGPADYANYRRKIESIPGVRFEVISLNRMYVEGNILYNGDQDTLMRNLANAGLRQQ